MSKIDEIIESDKMEIDTALNVLINAIQANYDNFNNFDKYLIGKSLSTFKSYYEDKQDIIIKFTK